MRNAAIVMGVCTSLACGMAASHAEPPTVHLTVRVVDETSAPVTNAFVEGLGFWRQNEQRGWTDANGLVRYRDRVYTDLACVVSKPGYYDSKGYYWSRSFGGPPLSLTNTVVLKRIIDPVPMVHRTVETHLPRLEVPVGFDLAEGDWVAPDGRGAVADVWFAGTMRYVSRDDHDIDVLLVFSNKLDGVQAFAAVNPDDQRIASDLMPPQLAPVEGYEGRLRLWQSSDPVKRLSGHLAQDRGYVLRVRTAVDEQGTVRSAYHAWTAGDIEVDPGYGKRIWMRIRYYLNPDPTSRSLEPKEIADRQGKYLPDAKP